MNHREKIAHYLADMTERGISDGTAASPAVRLLWRLGVQVPPPMFLGVAPLTLLMGVMFALPFGAGMWLLEWRAERYTVLSMLEMSVVAGLSFGFILAVFNRWKAWELRLPQWERYPEAE